MSKRVFWVVFLLLAAPMAAVGIMASPVGYLGALIYTKARNAVAEAVLTVSVDGTVAGRPVSLVRTLRCDGGSTATEDGAKLRFDARPGWLVHDLGQGDTLVLPVQGLCRAAVKAEWSFPSWSYTLRPRPDFAPLALVVGADGAVAAHALASSTTLALTVAEAAADAAPTAQPALPAGLAGGEFHTALLTPVPRDLLAYYPPVARIAANGKGVAPLDLLPPQIAFATWRLPESAEQLAAWPDAGRIATPLTNHPLPTLTGLRAVDGRLEPLPVPGVVALSRQPPAGATGTLVGVEVQLPDGRVLLTDTTGTPAVLETKRLRLPAE